MQYNAGRRPRLPSRFCLSGRRERSSSSHIAVIPAKAGIHFDLASDLNAAAKAKWIPAFAGMTKQGGIIVFGSE
jgi:hypothetical protein